MARHADKSTGNGQGNYDPARSKDVQEAGSGRHSSKDKDDQDREDDEDGGEK